MFKFVAAWREPDTMRAVGRFIQLFREQDLKPEQISGDETGLGQPICDRLAENGWHIRRVNNGSTSSKPEAYANTGAEIWFEGRTVIERQQIILPADDKELIAQLTARRGWPDSKGRLALESKADLRSRGLPSPDRADAMLGAILPREMPLAAALHRSYSTRETTLGGLMPRHGYGFDWPSDHPHRPRGSFRRPLL